MSNLTTLWLPESLGWQKKVQKHQNFTKYYCFHTEKDLKSKNGQQVYILTKDAITERKFEIIGKKIFDLKKVHPNSGS